MGGSNTDTPAGQPLWRTPRTFDVALGVHILERRKALKMSQAALAEAIGLTFQQIQKYERGFNRLSFSRLVDIAHALDCRVVDLAGGLDRLSTVEPALREPDAAEIHLRETGAPELLAAYATLPIKMRKAVLRLMKEMAANCENTSV